MVTFVLVLNSFGVIDDSLAFIVKLQTSPLMMLLLIMVLHLLAGCMVDPVSKLIIALPAVRPIVEALAFDPIWFGAIVMTIVEASAI